MPTATTSQITAWDHTRVQPEPPAAGRASSSASPSASSSFTTGPWLAGVLRLVGYPLALIVIVRWIPVVRQRLGSLFLLHQVGVGLIVAGWVLGRALDRRRHQRRLVRHRRLLVPAQRP